MTEVNLGNWWSGAIFSLDHKYRYALWRWWSANNNMALFIGLNPATADEIKNDPTITRCINFAKRWGYDGMWFGNIFAYRNGNPAILSQLDDPIGEVTDYWLKWMASSSHLIIGAWGSFKEAKKRSSQVELLLRNRELYCFGINQDGAPKHPLYQRSDSKPKLLKELRDEDH